jgi:hypothetical protein
VSLPKHPWAARIALAVSTLVAACLFFPYLASGIRGATGAMMIVVSLTAYVFTVIVLPLMLYALLRFAYTVFLRPYWRLWRLKRWRSTRDLKEVMRRRPSSPDN